MGRVPESRTPRPDQGKSKRDGELRRQWRPGPRVSPRDYEQKPARDRSACSRAGPRRRGSSCSTTSLWPEGGPYRGVLRTCCRATKQRAARGQPAADCRAQPHEDRTRSGGTEFHLARSRQRRRTAPRARRPAPWREVFVPQSVPSACRRAVYSGVGDPSVDRPANHPAPRRLLTEHDSRCTDDGTGGDEACGRFHVWVVPRDAARRGAVFRYVYTKQAGAPGAGGRPSICRT